MWKSICYHLLATLVVIVLVLEEVTFKSEVAAIVLQATCTRNTQCSATMAERSDTDEEELLMESETSQRLLLGGKFISPGTLRRNIPACGNAERGDPYSATCLPPPSNPYNRGCLRYYKCRHQ
ncbi:protein RALF-like 32 [Ricinus communis]|uniref:RALFL33, putative n=1 Tax=Ricinus communis TaxID=3988 RepID=B9S3P3_RICCO|nr:protein RALF-like 32 [Ricinus communis]EEF41748.1 RALFL33, putative [Ricinus communis]